MSGGYGVPVGTQLRAVLPGPDGSADAARAFVVMHRLLAVLARVEDVAAGGRGSDRSKWGLTQLALGSMVTTFAPSIPRRGLTTDVLDEVMARTVAGFEAAEAGDGIPAGWDHEVAAAAVELSDMLGLLPATGLHLELLVDDQPVRLVRVTRHSAEHLRAGLKITRMSVGAVTGQLDSVSRHDVLRASLWQEGTGRRIEVRFTSADEEIIRRAWGRRVMVSGPLSRDVAGRPIRIRLRELHELPEATRLPSEMAGIDPDMTGGLPADEYLREIRGAS